ncbi:MoaD/ThiS family protein [Paradesulfitobacterium ferrireducens]|uniref:MoaD/ThiS family protein n=1 Tax=Paradesulfitobacterium ferrireducens TaxID=2816476 RepID=UPI001A8FE5B2|nr:MoaD/ThiS family protein [Paradesulfitobacterium ferrireducens]
MRVLIKLFATFREGRFKSEEWELAPGATVAEVLSRLKIKPEEVSIQLVNGKDAALGQVLQDGDVMALFPPVGGG